eukprot:gene3912-716_t
MSPNVQLLSQKPQNPLAYLHAIIQPAISTDEVTPWTSLDLLLSASEGEICDNVGPLFTKKDRLSVLHQLITALGDACSDLGHPATDVEAERWGTMVYEAMCNPRRMFHCPQHALDVGGDGKSPIQVIA